MTMESLIYTFPTLKIGHFQLADLAAPRSLPVILENWWGRRVGFLFLGRDGRPKKTKTSSGNMMTNHWRDTGSIPSIFRETRAKCLVWNTDLGLSCVVSCCSQADPTLGVREKKKTHQSLIDTFRSQLGQDSGVHCGTPKGAEWDMVGIEETPR